MPESRLARARPRRLAPALTALFALALGACQSADGPPPSGPVRPTGAGRAPASYASAAEARAAFTRRSPGGVLTATLQDAAWLRAQGPPEEVERRYRSYFEHGYTTFDVELRPREFTRPTQEAFRLEDSQGQVVQGRPLSFQSSMGVSRDLGGDRFDYSFELSFAYVPDADVRWIRLTRELDGESVEWSLAR